MSNAKNTTVKDEVLKTYKNVDDLQNLTSNLNLDSSEDWKIRSNIVRETTCCADLMLQVFDNTNDGQYTEKGELFGVFENTLEISKHICKIVCRLCIDITLRFSSRNIKFCSGICDIPITLHKVLQSFKTITATVLFHNDFLYRTETIERRNSFLKRCIDFNIFVCNEMKTALKVMKRSKFRPNEEFKPLLASVVKQFYYIEIGCGLSRVLLGCDSRSNREIENENISKSLGREFKEMMKITTCLLISGRYALRSLSYKEDSACEVNLVCDEIRDLKNTIDSGIGELDYRLKITEVMSLKICNLFDLGNKCLPEGHQQIEDVTIISSSDFERFLEYDESKENGSDFAGFPEKDDLDDESLKRIPVEDIEDVLLSSDVDKSEILHVFKMEGFKSPVKVCIDNQSEFIRSKIDGTVFKQGLWISARDVVINGNRVSMTISPGKFFVVHYRFPKYQKTFSKQNMREGPTISIPAAKCSVMLPPSDVDRDVTFTCKIHMTDENRIKEYQKENPEEYGDVSVMNGVQMESTDEIKKGFVEFQRGGVQPSNDTVYFRFMTSGSGFKNWEYDKVEPKVQNNKLMFEVDIDDQSKRDCHKSYIVGVENVQTNKNKSDRILDIFLTLLGFKAQCKLLTLYMVPEDQDATINLCVLCIESKGFDLSDQASKYIRNKWIRIEEFDESSDFLITPGEAIRLVFRGNVGLKEVDSPVITFIKKGSCFARVQLHCLDKNNPRGYVQMDLNDQTLDSKQLDWNYLLEKWKYGPQSKIEKQEPVGEIKGSSHCNIL